MSTNLDKFLENLRHWTNQAAERAGEITKAAVNKADEFSRLGRLKMDLYNLEREQSRAQADFGALVYAWLKAGAKGELGQDEKIAKAIEQLDEIADRINRKRQDVAAAADVGEPVHAETPTKPAKEAAKSTAKAPPKPRTKAKKKPAGTKTTARKATPKKTTTKKAPSKSTSKQQKSSRTKQPGE